MSFGPKDIVRDQLTASVIQIEREKTMKGSSQSLPGCAPKSATSDAAPSAAEFLGFERQPGTPGCPNPECGDYPYYGVAPHECFYKRGAEFTIGQSVGLPSSQWPPNFIPDLEEGEAAETVSYPNACGAYVCPDCLGRDIADTSGVNDLARDDDK